MKDPASLVRDEIRALQGYHVPPAEGLVKLDAMENPYPLPPDLARELGETLSHVAINRYPHPGAPVLKRRLREAFSIPDALEIVLGNGSDEILQLIGMAVAKPGACVLSVEPAFAMFRISAIAVGLRYEGVALRPDFTLDEPALLAAIERHRPALTWIAYPNNPTGNLFPREAILRVVEASPGLVVVDEAYFPFAGGATLLDEVGRHPNLVLMRTVSKLGLAGLRLGFAVAPAAWAAELEKLRLPYNVNVLTAAAAELVLRRRDVLDDQTRRIVAERARLERSLDAMPGVTRFPSAANFVLARVPDAVAGFEGLKARGILVRTLHGSHPLLENCLRFTLGTPDENDRLAAALQQILA
ncbi:histidinol-phosphate transaminase [Betaproteobacteria bacterium GR16-43]|nr:histidinol-phosphate transaminase [Betaproteobacteria bacterium GR16-43]